MDSTQYALLNVLDGHIFEDKGWMLSDPSSPSASLVRAVYNEKKFEPDAGQKGLYRYHHWLPVHRALEGSCAPVTYKSEALAAKLGMSRLYITISGWFPEKGARFATCSFKETEAYSVCGRLPKDEKRTLVVASAGNTARAFASVCSKNNIPLVVTIPYDNMGAMWFDAPLNPCVKIIATPSGSDYFDAIALADRLCEDPRYFAEGGAKNIARRDGMGTTLLSAVEVIGEIPEAYFQAIGSGTGAIAAWENNLRLIQDGRFGKHLMRLMLSQNHPFTIMYDSWKLRQRTLVDFPAERAREASGEILAKVLSNRKPPYSLAGGLYDALVDTNGEIFDITNAELKHWGAEFEKCEGVDIHRAAAVAVASLAKALEEGKMKADTLTMLNVTGAGELKARKSLSDKLFQATPLAVLSPDSSIETILSNIQ